RHTRFSRDWSSDVCSSDLVVEVLPLGLGHEAADPEGIHHVLRGDRSVVRPHGAFAELDLEGVGVRIDAAGSRGGAGVSGRGRAGDRKSTRLNSSHVKISYA